MSPRTRLMTLLVVGAALVVAAVIALTAVVNRPAEAIRPDPVAATVPVALQAEGLPEDLTIGVVLTFGRSGEPGSEYNRAAQGAVVAAQRFAQGGAALTLPTANDRGTEDGARAAVQALAEQGVSGVVIASSGTQAQAAAQAASKLGLPAILPYVQPAEAAPSLWTTMPSRSSVDVALRTAVNGRTSVLLVTDGGPTPASVPIAQTLDLQDFDDVTGMAQEAAILTGDQQRAPDAPAGNGSTGATGSADAVVVSAATPQRLARLVQALQSRNVSVPLILPDGATAPDFASALSDLDGTASGQLVGIAPSAGDSAALQQDAQGRGMSAFLSAVRLAAGDADVKNLTGDAPFSADAWAADAASHDAVVALVRAVALAGSGDPSEVGEALRSVSLGPGEGLAGPPLDFSRPEALTAKAMPVYASPQDLGLRPADEDAPRLVWVPAPAPTPGP
ncbi:type 1 periplasmic-binding domain-containing protein [Arthrobacter sp. TmT3-37]